MSDEMQFLPEPPDGRWQEETTREEYEYWLDAIEDALSERWNTNQTEQETDHENQRNEGK